MLTQKKGKIMWCNHLWMERYFMIVGFVPINATAQPLTETPQCFGNLSFDQFSFGQFSEIQSFPTLASDFLDTRQRILPGRGSL